MSTVAQRATVVHGYSLDRIDRLTHAAVGKVRGGIGLLDPVEAREEAWQGIVELLYLSPEKPAEWSLVNAGAQAVARQVSSRLRHHGLRHTRSAEGGYEVSPSFQAYWEVERGAEGWVHRVGAKPDWTDAIIERMALPRALSTLTPLQYQALVALAAHGSSERAASFLGISYSAVKQRVRAGRIRILEVWFEGETAHSTSKADLATQCRYGHPRAEYGFRQPTGAWVCKRCNRASARRRSAKGIGRVEVDVEELDSGEAPVLTFAPAPDEDPDAPRTAANTCWCGLPVGHDWPDKDQGAAHPR